MRSNSSWYPERVHAEARRVPYQRIRRRSRYVLVAFLLIYVLTDEAQSAIAPANHDVLFGSSTPIAAVSISQHRTLPNEKKLTNATTRTTTKTTLLEHVASAPSAAATFETVLYPTKMVSKPSVPPEMASVNSAAYTAHVKPHAVRGSSANAVFLRPLTESKVLSQSNSSSTLSASPDNSSVSTTSTARAADVGKDIVDQQSTVLQDLSHAPKALESRSWSKFSSFFAMGTWQFIGLILGLSLIYLAESAADYLAEKQFRLRNRVSTCLLFGANFRDLGITTFAFLARLITSGFLHISVLQFLSNLGVLVFSLALFVFCVQLDASAAWFGHWIFFIYCVSAITKALSSHVTRLSSVGLSVGSSGGVLGVYAATFSFYLLYLKSYSFWTSLLVGFGFHGGYCLLLRLDSPDVLALSTVFITGLVLGISGHSMQFYVNPKTFARLGDSFCSICIALTAVAFLEVAKEAVMDGRELVVRAYVKWLHLEETLSTGKPLQRRTCYARLHCEKLTEDFLYLLEYEGVPKNSQAVLKRLDKESKHIRKSLPELGGHVC